MTRANPYAFVPFVVVAACVASCRHAPAEPQAPDAAPVVARPTTSAPPPPAPSVVASAPPAESIGSGTVATREPVDQQRAEAIAMVYARSHWKKYRAQNAVAFREGANWKVVISFVNSDSGAHVIIEQATGRIVDAGIAADD